MYFLSLALLTVFATFGNFQQLFPKNGVNYGPYELNVSHIGVCPGVKLQRTQAAAYLEETAHEKYLSVLNITFFNSSQLNFVKIFVYRGSDLSSYAWKYLIKNPCEHPVTALILNEYLDIDHRCNIKEGQYSMRMAVSETASVLFGKQFFYGAFSFKVVLSSKNYVISCMVLKGVFTKSNVK